jgi:hypothetical protein
LAVEWVVLLAALKVVLWAGLWVGLWVVLLAALKVALRVGLWVELRAVLWASQ